MKRVNPSFILRNHLAQEAVDAAVEELDFEPMQRLLPLLARPFDDHPEDADTIRPPAKAERVTRTFCGT
jgi:serine/tyrosine/threonine adenylyltransferase